MRTRQKEHITVTEEKDGTIKRVFQMKFDIAENWLTTEQDKEDLYKEIEHLIENYYNINQEPLGFKSVGAFNIQDMSHEYSELVLKELK